MTDKKRWRLSLMLAAALMITTFAWCPDWLNPFPPFIKWTAVKCAAYIVGPGEPHMLKISFTYSYSGQEYTSTRYSNVRDEMPEKMAAVRVSTAYVNPNRPSDAVLTLETEKSDSYSSIGLKVIVFGFMVAASCHRRARKAGS